MTAEVVRELLDYDPKTALFTWKRRDRKWFRSKRSWNSWNVNSVDKLEAFIAGGPLAPNALRALTKLLFHGNAIWDEKLDRLKSAHTRQPVSLGSGPPPLDPATLPKFKGGPPGPGPQPVTPPKVEPKKSNAPGGSNRTHKTGAGGMSALGAKRKGPIGKPR